VSHYTHTDPYPSKTQHNITQYREKCLKRGDVGSAKLHPQCTWNVKGTVLSNEYTSKSLHCYFEQVSGRYEEAKSI
jgi:hypothetical protein